MRWQCFVGKKRLRTDTHTHKHTMDDNVLSINVQNSLPLAGKHLWLHTRVTVLRLFTTTTTTTTTTTGTLTALILTIKGPIVDDTSTHHKKITSYTNKQTTSMPYLSGKGQPLFVTTWLVKQDEKSIKVDLRLLSKSTLSFPYRLLPFNTHKTVSKHLRSGVWVTDFLNPSKHERGENQVQQVD